MNAFEPGLPPSIGRVAPDGRLLDAEPRLAELNRRAGGAIGDPLAIPQIATLARLAQRLGITVSRQLLAGDGDDDIDLWVAAEPDELGVRIEVAGWQARPPLSASPDAAADFVHADADWRWATDAALHLTFVSDGAAERFGFDPASVLGQPVTRLFALADDADGGFPMLGAVAAQARFDGQDAVLRGTAHRVRLSAVPLADPTGRFAGFTGAVRMLPPPVEADAAPALPAAFGERIGRALRDPLGRIVANADSISAQTEGPLAPDYAEYAADIASAGRHLIGLVDDLADLAAVERADFTIEAEAIDLAEVARRAAGLLSVRAGRVQVTIDRPDLDATLPATGEFRRVLQILVNLLGNAVRYSPAGGHVWIRLQRDRDDACVLVADQGKGIAPADQARIFEKFGRLDPSEPGGSGLGLYIARRLARAMDGDLTVDSMPGEGARFVLRLPGR